MPGIPIQQPLGGARSDWIWPAKGWLSLPESLAPRHRNASSRMRPGSSDDALPDSGTEAARRALCRKRAGHRHRGRHTLRDIWCVPRHSLALHHCRANTYLKLAKNTTPVFSSSLTGYWSSSDSANPALWSRALRHEIESNILPSVSLFFFPCRAPNFRLAPFFPHCSV
ncbi:hypothetical protein K505DRAFT_24552 [Melanomma pulvis-pyrius CBS 109.77]|uniref:Uncharacterized protein n=1 Tax=Melanomma pulvis-pyrius CBS 109.77 TaxID=1314802 RepID=A0A6A6XEQ9_9PLEO|nr:hypothetical protein K505DRAFT_24552 [Melanomma pulvis-pyrius CBS 109.77]